MAKTSMTYSHSGEMKSARSKGYQKPTMTVARHIAVATVVDDTLAESIVERIAEGDERFSAGNLFGLQPGTKYYLVACRESHRGRVYQTFAHRYYVVVERNDRFVASIARASEQTGAKVVALVEQFIAAQQAQIQEQEAVDETAPDSESQAYLNHALSLITATRPAWQAAYEPLAPEIQAGIDRCLDGIRRQMDALFGGERYAA